MDIAIPLYDRFTGLDALGRYEVLARLPGARVRCLAAQPDPEPPFDSGSPRTARPETIDAVRAAATWRTPAAPA